MDSAPTLPVRNSVCNLYTGSYHRIDNQENIEVNGGSSIAEMAVSLRDHQTGSDPVIQE